MNFIKFHVSNVNSFPVANSVSGWQLLTEFNLRSLDSVMTHETIQYFSGPSYAHSEGDFLVSRLLDGVGTEVSQTILQVSAGRAIVNGHYFESMSPITIDLLQVNKELQLDEQSPLKGGLSIGIRAMYSTLPTMAGSLMVKDAEDYFEGMQVVILPTAEFILPTDSPYDPNKVTAHLLLATFNFTNSKISSLVNNYPGKIRAFPAHRIGNIDELISDTYIRKTGLDPDHLYTFAGKGKDPATGLDTWCKSTDSLIIWDRSPVRTTTKPVIEEAQFTAVLGKTQLLLPHKQVDGMTNTSGQREYWRTHSIDLPLADFGLGTGGTVDKKYTDQVKRIVERISELYNLPNGRQLCYIRELLYRDTRVVTDDSYDSYRYITHLPLIDQANWNPGDYVLVGLDRTFTSDDTVQPATAPSTLYVIVPGFITSILDAGTTRPSGIELAQVKGTDPAATAASAYWAVNTYRGSRYDYFTYLQVDPNSGATMSRAFYSVMGSGPKEFINPPIILTGEIPLAQTDLIGGFLNVDDSMLDAGYVVRDSEGHLRMLDYGLLRSGTLAYQLGEDFSTAGGTDAQTVQEYLDEYVCQRVAFPNGAHIKAVELANEANPGSATINVINITLELVAESVPRTIDLYDIDSRFNTSIYVTIAGTADKNTTINISDCAKVRINPRIGGTPVINLARSSLYYDAEVLNRLDSIQDLSLWYEKFDSGDASILVDGMRVMEPDAPVIAEDLDFWTPGIPNDNHFLYGLRSVTFDTDGYIVGCELYISNNSTANVELGDTVVSAAFSLPQGNGLIYPVSRLVRQLKVTGTFVAAYPTTTGNPTGYRVHDTNFTALSEAYDQYDDVIPPDAVMKGSIAFHVRAVQVTQVQGLGNDVPLDAWKPGTWHIFSGSALPSAI